MQLLLGKRRLFTPEAEAIQQKHLLYREVLMRNKCGVDGRERGGGKGSGDKQWNISGFRI